MQVLDDDVQLCADCAIYAANGDLSGIDSDERAAEVKAAVEAMGPHLSYNMSEGDEAHFSWSPCECCGSHLGGDRLRFALLTDEPEDDSSGFADEVQP